MFDADPMICSEVRTLSYQQKCANSACQTLCTSWWNKGTLSSINTCTMFFMVSALLSEMTLFLTHSMVLFNLVPNPLRMILTYDALRNMRLYFVWDLVSPWCAMSIVTKPPGWLMIPACYHSCLHMFYIFTWNSSHTKKVISMSTKHAYTRSQYPLWERAWFVVGTLSDIGIHACMIWITYIHIRTFHVTVT